MLLTKSLWSFRERSEDHNLSTTLSASFRFFSKSIVCAPGIFATLVTWFSSAASWFKYTCCTSNRHSLIFTAIGWSGLEANCFLRSSRSASLSRLYVSRSHASSLSRSLWNIVRGRFPGSWVFVSLIGPMLGLMPTFKKREVNSGEGDWRVDFGDSMFQLVVWTSFIQGRYDGIMVATGSPGLFISCNLWHRILLLNLLSKF